MIALTGADFLALANSTEGRQVLADSYEEQGRHDVARLYRDELPVVEGKRLKSLRMTNRQRCSTRGTSSRTRRPSDVPSAKW